MRRTPGELARLLGVLTLTLSSPACGLNEPSAYLSAGTHCWGVGDVDGDGRDDVLVRFRSDDVTGQSRWRGVVLSVAERRVLREEVTDWPAARRRPVRPGWFDAVVLPDLDGDGGPEVCVRKGTASHLVVSARDGSVLFPVGNEGESLGTMAAVGDVDGDGRDDLLFLFVTDSYEERAALVVSGRDGSELLRFASPNDDEPTWQVVVGSWGDADGDGRRDLALGDKLSGRLRGRVVVHSSRDGAVVDVVWGAERAFLGKHIDAMGDVDGDGAGEILLERWHLPSLLLSGADAHPVRELALHRARPAGDVDGDGVPDLAGLADPLRLDRLAVVSGADGSALLELPLLAGPPRRGGGEDLDWHGVGDLDGDGHADLAIWLDPELKGRSPDQHATPGVIELRSGADGSLLWRLDRDELRRLLR